MNFNPQKNKRSKDKKSKTYAPPQSILTMVNMEMGIAASSTTVNPTNSSNQIQEQYDLQEQDREFDW